MWGSNPIWSPTSSANVSNAVVRYRDGTLGQILGTPSMYPGSLKRLQVAGRGGTAEILEDELVRWSFHEERPEEDDIRERFEAEYIRLFSYYISEGEGPADHRDEVLRRMRRKAELTEEHGLVLLNENEKGLYGDAPGRMHDIHLAVDSPNLRMVFDSANYLELGIQPYPDALLQVVEFFEHLHIKDAELGVRGEMKPAVEGDGRIPETLDALVARGFEGYLSLEPHLQVASEAGGFSDEDRFRTATRVLRDVLESVDDEPPAAVREG